MYYIDIKNFGIIPYSLSKNGVIICGNLRGLRENKTPAELAGRRRKDITRFKGIILNNFDYWKTHYPDTRLQRSVLHSLTHPHSPPP